VTATAFKTKGDQPEWRMVYDAIQGKDFGDLISYKELDAALGRDFRTNRQPLYRAAEELLAEQRRALTSVPNQGYRVVEAREHEDLARADHKSARRKIRRGIRRLAGAERSRLTNEEKARIDLLELGYRRHDHMLRRLDARVEKQNTEIQEVKAQVADLQRTLKARGFTKREIGPASNKS
jgi:hypothetical protein